jgi:hypothetical protein
MNATCRCISHRSNCNLLVWHWFCARFDALLTAWNSTLVKLKLYYQWKLIYWSASIQFVNALLPVPALLETWEYFWFVSYICTLCIKFLGLFRSVSFSFSSPRLSYFTLSGVYIDVVPRLKTSVKVRKAWSRLVYTEQAWLRRRERTPRLILRAVSTNQNVFDYFAWTRRIRSVKASVSSCALCGKVRRNVEEKRFYCFF